MFKSCIQVLILGVAVTPFATLSIVIFNLAYGEEAEPQLVAHWWGSWGLALLSVLLITVLGYIGHTFRVRAFRLKTQTLEHKISCLQQDLVELKERLQATEDSAEDFRRNAQAVGQAWNIFFNTISHELYTPLNGILGYAGILRRKPEVDDSIRDGLDVILQSGEDLQFLVNDLLDIARIGAGTLELCPEPIQLSVILEQLNRLIQPKAENKGLSFTTLIKPQVPSAILIDEARLCQVLRHLLDSAVKSTKQGHVTLAVESLDDAGLNKGSNVNLSFIITSSGTSITSDQLRQVTLPFDQRTLGADGAGLGLTICQKIIRHMGGQLRTESAPGKGSRMWFDIVCPVALSCNEASHKSTNSVCGYHGERRKLLVVDDKLYNRLLLTGLLEPLGFEVLLAEDGQAAVEQAIEWHPDAILLDLVMPVKSGFEVVQDIRMDSRVKDVIIIAISASVSDSDRKKCTAIGCNAYLSKPIRIEKVLSMLAELLNLAWIYTDSASEADSALIAPPIEDLNLLYQLALEGEVYEIQNYAVQLEDRNEMYAPFCRKLKQLGKGFEVAQIAEFIKRFTG